MKTENEKSKTHIVKIEYDKKVLTEEGDNLKNEIKEFKLMKNKYHDLMREHKLLNEDKQHL